MMLVSFKIVSYQNRFRNGIVKIWEQCGLIRPQNDPMKDIETKMGFQPDLFLVAVLGDQVVGSVMAGYGGHRGWLNYLAVAPEQQHKGYGRLTCRFATITRRPQNSISIWVSKKT